MFMVYAKIKKPLLETACQGSENHNLELAPGKEKVPRIKPIKKETVKDMDGGKEGIA